MTCGAEGARGGGGRRRERPDPRGCGRHGPGFQPRRAGPGGRGRAGPGKGRHLPPLSALPGAESSSSLVSGDGAPRGWREGGSGGERPPTLPASWRGVRGKAAAGGHGAAL